MVKEVFLKTVRYTDWMTDEAKKVVDRFNQYAEETSGALEDHLCLVPLNDATLDDMIDTGYYEYTSQNPHFGELNNVLEALRDAARPYHDTCCWTKDILTVF